MKQTLAGIGRGALRRIESVFLYLICMVLSALSLRAAVWMATVALTVEDPLEACESWTGGRVLGRLTGIALFGMSAVLAIFDPGLADDLIVIALIAPDQQPERIRMGSPASAADVASATAKMRSMSRAAGERSSPASNASNARSRSSRSPGATDSRCANSTP
ncbi:MAG: hypothetical protein JNM98_06195 [Rhodocyclaceae bacterium]|nr:hypothetical protein [Rhodocyclaceae bacterium]